MSVFCTNCGSPMDDDARFCPECGAEMIPESEVPKAPGETSRGNNVYEASKTGYVNTGNVNSGSYNGGNANSGSFGNGGWSGNTQGSGSYTGPSGSSGSYGQGAYPGSNMGQGSFQRPQTGGYGGGGMPPKNSGGFPKIIFLLLGIVAIVVAIVIAVFVIKGFTKGKSKDTDETTEAVIETEVEDESRGSRENGEEVEETTASKATGDLANIKLPDGAEVKTDAMLWDLIGEYKGEIQMTRIEGYEKMDGVTEEAIKALNEMLKSPVECELEIEEDGQWSISWPMMGRKSTFESDEYDNPKEFTPEEINALMITMPSNGVYHARIDKEEEVDDGSMGKMKLEHIGAYCTDGDDRLIAGNFFLELSMNEVDVVMQGDFVVHKTSEEFAKEEREVIDSLSEKKKSTLDEDEEEADDSGEDNDYKGQLDSDALGKKAEALTKKNMQEEDEAETKVEIPTVSGGKWKQVGSEWMYEKDKKLVKNSWILHKNVYYYVDENGFMLTDGYTPDGYYVGKDGAWDQKKSKYDKSGGNTTSEVLSESEQREIADELSTSEDARALDFDWFYDYVLNNGRENGRVITDKKLARRITDEQAALNGGWKAFMFTKDGDYGSDGERYLNATVDTKGNKFNITLNWKYFIDPVSKKTITETGHTTFKGSYDDLEGTAVCRTDDAMIEFDEFYISTDGQTEYAVGTFHWISGEIDQIALMR
ncbi:zinc-ribbon domain-containing protein [Oribacterium sp. C9]|uniref:zinc-ribbon domain-containing protein n=1 Tax=Oribacterium sp. C9 TaxID=1943579 RepID=UPI000990038B|nr:zinc-ribbon domain-containing protein [Oribacterium sp. C9]